jgi:hypothetical protein
MLLVWIRWIGGDLRISTSADTSGILLNDLDVCDLFSAIFG